jgi:hypothetical protein
VALAEASELIDVKLILDCQNTRTKKRVFKNFAYYVLNVVSLKSTQTKKIAYERRNIETIRFDSIYKGMWQNIPAEVTEAVKARGITLVIKFGMSLLTIDENVSALDILSFHHGDPAFYRGRPAGFYEIHHYANKVGIIVQKLSNTLDGGEVLVEAHSKIEHHSYKQTACNYYVNSRFLLRKAITNYTNGIRIPKGKLGKNYSLPGNFTVLLFCAKLLKRKLFRLGYGAFVERKWNVVRFDEVQGMESLNALHVSKGAVPKIDGRYLFYADPFFSTDGAKIRVEALNTFNGLGEIVELDSRSFLLERVLLKGAHYSYPYSFDVDGHEYLIPEVADHSHPVLLKPQQSEQVQSIKGFEGSRLLDASIVKHDGRYYLFAGLADSATDCLYLFVGDEPGGPFVAHPGNPIVIDPASARMGGRICSFNDKLYRFGQDNCYGYGDRITVAEILELTPERYAERRVNQLAFDDARGPHTVDIVNNSAVLDYYVYAFSVFAGYRRLMAKLARRY